MNLQAKLTLGAVLLETLIVGAISAVDLGNAMEIEFEAARKPADVVRLVAGDYVAQTLNRMRDKPLREALRDPSLSLWLNNVMTASEGLFEIAVVDPHNEILADTDPSRLGVFEPPYPDFQTLVAETWFEKVNLLASRKNSFYQMEKPLGTTAGETLVTVRVVVDAALIRRHVRPTLTRSAQVALLLFAGAVGLTFLVSALAFRRLGKLGHMLDLVASGEYAPDKDVPEKLGQDELAIMASKVSILSER